MKTITHAQRVSWLAAIACAMCFVVTDGASAQVNCNVLPHGAARANCYGQESQFICRSRNSTTT
jgi:hypothetical protein